jgi:hypothetical protein
VSKNLWTQIYPLPCSLGRRKDSLAVAHQSQPMPSFEALAEVFDPWGVVYA